jgi:DNA-binding transcriptional MerR regulator
MEDLVTIGTFSMLSGLSVVALRPYAEVGVLKPAPVDTLTGYRRYTRAQLEQAWLIAQLGRIDLPLDDVRSLLEAGPAGRREVLVRHRHQLRARGRDVDTMVVLTQGLLDKEDSGMPVASDVRLVAANIGVQSKEELDTAARFWEAVFGTTLEDWTGHGLSRQARVGRDARAFFFNLRVREEGEPHFGHRAAFGIAVADLDAFRGRALEAGAFEHYPPVESEEQPRHCLIQDPVGNRVVIWQGG